MPGKGLVLVNLREHLFDAAGWNTVSIEVRGSRVAVWLNGEEIGAVRCASIESGRIGLHVKGGPEYANAEMVVREVLVQELAGE